MSRYGLIYPEFWTGATGRALRTRGGAGAQLLALYVLSSQHANMIGLYHLPLDYAARETGLKPKAVVLAAAVLESEAFAFYDVHSEYVWVREMARIRLSIPLDGSSLQKDDKRAIGAKKLYQAIAVNPYLGLFHDRYGRQLHLGSRRTPPQDVAPSKELVRGFEGASKGLRSQETDQEQDQEQGSGTGKSTGAGAPGFPQAVEDDSRPSHRLVCAIVHEVYDRQPPVDPLGVTEEIKILCAQRGLRYGSAVINRARDAVDVSREKAGRYVPKVPISGRATA